MKFTNMFKSAILIVASLILFGCGGNKVTMSTGANFDVTRSIYQLSLDDLAKVSKASQQASDYDRLLERSPNLDGSYKVPAFPTEWVFDSSKVKSAYDDYVSTLNRFVATPESSKVMRNEMRDKVNAYRESLFTYITDGVSSTLNSKGVKSEKVSAANIEIDLDASPFVYVSDHKEGNGVVYYVISTDIVKNAIENKKQFVVDGVFSAQAAASVGAMARQQVMESNLGAQEFYAVSQSMGYMLRQKEQLAK